LYHTLKFYLFLLSEQINDDDDDDEQELCDVGGYTRPCKGLW